MRSRRPSTSSEGTQTSRSSPASSSLASLAASLRSFFLVLDSDEVGILEGAIGTTSTSPEESSLAGTNPVQPASYTPRAGAGNSDIHAAIAP